MSEAYEFKVNHTDNTTSATYYGSSMSCVSLDEWRGRSLEDFAAGMAGRGFRHHVENHDICGRRWDTHMWVK